MRNIRRILILTILFVCICTNICLANNKIITPTNSKVFLNYEQLHFETYLIEGYNYFKLRDLAYVFKDTSKAFEVKWNEELYRIDISLNTKYTSLGNEMLKSNPNFEEKEAIQTQASLFVNGNKKDLIAYEIDGYNYFKLRDILEIIDCGVIYDDNTQNINLYTYFSYVTDKYAKVPILLYHHFDTKADGSNDMIITPQKFENDILTILSNGYTPISFLELINYVEMGISLPQKPIIITMDDGYFSNYEYVFPLLKEYDIKATMFPIIRYSEENLSKYPHFNYLHAKEMLDSGLIEIQPHTFDMHIQISDHNSFYRDTMIAIERLKNNLNTNVYAFAFPYGVHNSELQYVLDCIGIKVSLITDEGLNFVDKGDINSLKLLKRYSIYQHTDLDNLLKEINEIKK